MNKIKRVVVKVGTKVITSKDRTLDAEQIKQIASQVSGLMDNGIEVILVTSGAIGSGMHLLQMKKRPSDLANLQAAAAIGQNYLMSLYSGYFNQEGYNAGQILLTQDDFDDRKRYLNIKHTINALLEHGAVPIINENDTVATEEIKCGDNDRLSSLVADLCGADKLILLSDVDGLLDASGRVVAFVSKVTPEILRLGGKSHCDLGTGGMVTKIEAARFASEAGIECVVANGKARDVLCRLMLQDEKLGTTFISGKGKLMAKKRWIAYSSKSKGVIVVDAGAQEALLQRNKSLLASGIVGVEGQFSSGDAVKIAGKDGREFARGITSYSSAEIAKVKGLKTGQIRSVIGSAKRDEVIHKDNLVIL